MNDDKIPSRWLCNPTRRSMYRRRIGEYPHFHQHVYRPSLPSCLTTCACDSLSLSYMATRTGLYLRRSRWSYLPLACRRSWSNVLHTFHSPHVHEPAPRLSFHCANSRLCPSGCSNRSLVIVRPCLPLDRSCRAGMDVGGSRFGSLTMMQRTLTTLSHLIG